MITTVAIGIIKRNGLYLIGQITGHRRHPFKWEFPGGKMQPGEHPRETLVRELYEELGIAAIPGRYVHNCMYDPECELVFILVDKFFGEPQCKEHVKLAWVRLEDMHEYDLIDAFMLDALRNI